MKGFDVIGSVLAFYSKQAAVPLHKPQMIMRTLRRINCVNGPLFTLGSVAPIANCRPMRCRISPDQDYNEIHPHSALKMASSRQFIRANSN
jgi:hypothetical protein